MEVGGQDQEIKVVWKASFVGGQTCLFWDLEERESQSEAPWEVSHKSPYISILVTEKTHRKSILPDWVPHLLQ